MIGIIGAVLEEAEAIRNEMKNISEKTIYGIHFYEGEINEQKVVFVQSGIGKVNAAITATLLIDKFDVSRVIFSGVAGSLHESVNVGDVVIGTEIIQYDVDAIEFGYPKGQIPQMATLGFKSDEELINKAKNINTKINLSYGKIITGDQFVSGKDKKISLGNEFQALCVDMESGSVAQVCYRLGVPFLIVRSISDSVSDASGIEYHEFVKKAAKNSVEIIQNIL